MMNSSHSVGGVVVVEIKDFLEGGGKLFLLWYCRYPPTSRSMVLDRFTGATYLLALEEEEERETGINQRLLVLETD